MNVMTKEEEFGNANGDPFGFGAIGALCKMGVSPKKLGSLVFDKELCAAVAKHINEADGIEIIPASVARDEFAHGHFFGPEEWDANFGISSNSRKFSLIANEFPWGHDVLDSPCPFTNGEGTEDGNRIKDTHCAFLGIEVVGRRWNPFTLLQLQKLSAKAGIDFSSHFYKPSWFKKERFMTEKASELRWYLMPIEAVLTDMTCAEQDEAVNPEYEFAHVGEEVLKHFLYNTLNGEFIDSNYGRCSNTVTVAENHHAIVASSNHFGLCIDHAWNHGNSSPKHGVALSRKLPNL